MSVYTSRAYYNGSAVEGDGTLTFPGKGVVVGGGASLASGYSSGYSSNYSTLNGGTTTTKVVTSYSSSSATKHADEKLHHAAVAYSSGAAITGHFDTRLLLDIRDREKLTIIGLNDRLANYVENVRFLKIDNARLAQYLNALRAVRFQDVTVSATDELERVSQKQRESIDGVTREHEALRREARDLDARLQQLVKLPQPSDEGIAAILSAIAAVEVQIMEKRRYVIIAQDRLNQEERERAMLLAKQTEMRRLIEEQRRLRVDAQSELNITKKVIRTIDIQHHIGVEELLAQSPWNSAEWEKFKAALRARIAEIRTRYEGVMEQSRLRHESSFKSEVDSLIAIRQKRAVLPGAKELRDEILRLLQELMTIEQAHFSLKKQIEEVNFQIEDQSVGFGVIVSEKRAQITSYSTEISALLREMELLLKQKETLEAELKVYRQILESEEVRIGASGQLQLSYISSGYHDEGAAAVRRSTSSAYSSSSYREVSSGGGGYSASSRTAVYSS